MVRDRQAGDLGRVRGPRRVRRDGSRRRQLGDASEPDLGTFLAGALRDGHGKAVDVPCRAVMDDQHTRFHRSASSPMSKFLPRKMKHRR